MLTDSTGYAPKWWNRETLYKACMWTTHPFLMWMIDDYNDIQSDDVTFIPNTEEGGGQIRNSYKVQNPVIILWYSYRLRSEYGEYLDGTPEGIASEWMIHNAAYDALFLPNKIGMLEKELKRAAHTDIGRTVFHEDDWYIVGPTIALQYSMNRTSVIIDFTIYLTTRDGE